MNWNEIPVSLSFYNKLFLPMFFKKISIYLLMNTITVCFVFHFLTLPFTFYYFFPWGHLESLRVTQYIKHIIYRKDAFSLERTLLEFGVALFFSDLASQAMLSVIVGMCVCMCVCVWVCVCSLWNNSFYLVILYIL